MRCSAAVQLICIFVFVYAKVRFSNSAAHLDVSNFCFEGRSSVLIVLAPGNCLSFTFYNLQPYGYKYLNAWV